MSIPIYRLNIVTKSNRTIEIPRSLRETDISTMPIKIEPQRGTSNTILVRPTAPHMTKSMSREGVISIAQRIFLQHQLGKLREMKKPEIPTRWFTLVANKIPEKSECDYIRAVGEIDNATSERFRIEFIADEKGNEDKGRVHLYVNRTKVIVDVPLGVTHTLEPNDIESHHWLQKD